MKNFLRRGFVCVLLPLALLLTVSAASDQNQHSFASSSASVGQSSDLLAQLAQLSASDGTRKNQFGLSIAMSGNTVVVGAPGANDGRNQGAGAIYVFTKPTSGWANMTQTAKLTCANGTTAILFCGLAVAVSGDTIVTDGYDPTISQNVALVFAKPAGGWKNMTQTAELTVTDAGTSDGGFNAFAISGNTILAGAESSSVFGGQQGEAYIFVEPASGWANMTQTAILFPPQDQQDYTFGSSVALSGNVAVVGAEFASTDVGAAYVFVEPEGGWVDMSSTAVLTASDGTSDDAFAVSAAIDGTTVVVGASSATIGSHPAQGAAYVYVEPQGGWQNMTETAKLTTSTGGTGNLFGASVSASGNAVLIGAPNVKIESNTAEGEAYIFQQPPTGWVTTTQPASKFSAGTKGSNFGASVVLSGATAVVGAPTGVSGGTKSTGAAYVFGP
jgi:FG-GAP repeat